MNGSDPEAIAKAAKAAAEARTAAAAASKAERENREAEEPLTKSKQEADAQKAVAEAQQQVAETQQKQFAALLPDLGKVTPGSLETKAEDVVFGTSLAQRATSAAAELVADDVAEAIPDLESARILVTSDTELASSDAIYVEVMNGLDELIDAANSLVGDAAPRTGLQQGKRGIAAPVLPALQAVAAALPGALSLLSAHRTLTTSAVTTDSLAAAAVTAGCLAQRRDGPTVFHDDIRLLPTTGPVRKKLGELGDKRHDLIDRKAAFEGEKASESAALVGLKAGIEEAMSKLLTASDEPERATLQATLDRERPELESHEAKVAESAVRVGAIDGTMTAIDHFTAALQVTAAGAKRSPLAAAILREELHADAESRFTHVLLVKAEPGSAQQLVDDLPLLFNDRFSTIATSSVTYMLVDAGDGRLIDSGSIGGEAKISGTVGHDFSITSKVIAAE